jgi:hypothetical protein
VKIGGRETSSSGILVSGYEIRNTKKCGGRGESAISTLVDQLAENSFTFGLGFGKGGCFWDIDGLVYVGFSPH